MRRWPEVEKVEGRQKGKWPSWMGHSLTLWTAMVELAPSLTFTFLSESSFRVGQSWMLVRPLLGLVGVLPGFSLISLHNDLLCAATDDDGFRS